MTHSRLRFIWRKTNIAKFLAMDDKCKMPGALTPSSLVTSIKGFFAFGKSIDFIAVFNY